MNNTITERKSPYNYQELKYFRDIIIKKLNEATQDLESLKKALQEDMDNVTTKVTCSTHMGDIGTNTRERDKIYIIA